MIEYLEKLRRQRDALDKAIAEEEAKLPRPKYRVGDWVELRCGGQYRVKRAVGDTCVLDVGILPEKTCTWIGNKHTASDTLQNDIIRKLSPSDVVLDFGNGIKGKILAYRDGAVEPIDGYAWVGSHIINYTALSEPMKSTVLELLKAQSEEEK